jgi:hypothetical protein
MVPSNNSETRRPVCPNSRYRMIHSIARDRGSKETRSGPLYTTTAGAVFTDRYEAAASLPPATGAERRGFHLLVFESFLLPGKAEDRLVIYLSQH